jgi:hypothetical protein
MILINGIPFTEAGDIRYIVLVAVACIVYWLLWKKDRDRRNKDAVFKKSQSPNCPDLPVYDCSDCCFSRRTSGHSGVCMADGDKTRVCRDGWAGCFQRIP